VLCKFERIASGGERTMRIVAIVLLGLALLAGGAQDAGAPLPMLDTGGHMAKINGIAFTPDGRQLVSASNDKTIRVWELASGKTVRTIRGESAPGLAGMVYAMALSPDGKWLAAGGLDGR
jgi:WD40 repeat protein